MIFLHAITEVCERHTIKDIAGLTGVKGALQDPSLSENKQIPPELGPD